MSDLPRLLLCSFDVIPGPTGSSRRMTEYLKALPDRFNVVVLSVKTPDHSHIEKYQGARLLRVPVGSGDLGSRIQAFERAMRRQLESEDYALVHYTDPFCGYTLCELKADYGYRLVYEAQTFPSMEMRFTHPQTDGDRRFLTKVRRQELFCLMSSDRVVTGSQVTRAYIQSLGVGEDTVRTVRAPVDLEAYKPELLGAPDGTPLRLMYLGSQVGWQGLPTLLRALALASARQDMRLTVLGPRHPDWQPHLEELVAELGLRERVEFQPPVPHDDLPKVLALADVGVLPLDDIERNRLQGGPLAKASEYFAAARPVLAADLPVTRELLPSSATVFYPPGDARALAERLVELARDTARRTSLGLKGRAYAERHLDAGLVRGRLLDIYGELLGPGAPVATSAYSEPPMTALTGTPTNRLLNMQPPGSDADPPQAPKASSASAPLPGEPQPPAPAPEETPRDELPLLLGQVLAGEELDHRLIKTEPEARPGEPPVVMGLPLRDTPQAAPAAPAPAAPLPSKESPMEESADEAPIIAGTALSGDESTAPTPVHAPPAAPAPPPLPVRAAPAPPPQPPPQRAPPPLPPIHSRPSSTGMRSVAGPEPVPPRPSSVGVRSVARPEPVPSTPSSAGMRSVARPEPVPPAARPAPASDRARTQPTVPSLGASPGTGSGLDSDEDLPEAEAEALSGEEPLEISDEEIQEDEEAPALPPSALDPWFVQLAHGYCPPEGARFIRPTPPTNFPGREAPPPPAPPSRGRVS